MGLRSVSTAEMLGAAALTTAGFALGYLTPFGSVIILLLVAPFLIGGLLGGGEGPGPLVADVLGRAGAWAWTPVDKATSSPGRLWVWRAPGIATLAGFLLAWGQNLNAGAS